MSKELKGKTILITGASSGIGAKTAYELANKGATLILVARRTDQLEKVKENCEKVGAHKSYVFSVDLAQTKQIDHLINFIEENYLRIDILINNAGFGYAGLFVKMSFKQIKNMFNVNVLGLMYLTQQISLKMLDEEKGQIINIASLAGKVATADYAIYAATKAAVIAFSNSLRMELKDFEVMVTVINFGPVASPFFDQIVGPRKEKSLNGLFTIDTDKAAKIVASSIGKRKREINRPVVLAIGAKFYQLSPSIIDKIMFKYFNL